MRDTLLPSPLDRLTASLCHPCRDERIRALGLIFSDPSFLSELDRRARVLASKYRWVSRSTEAGDLRSAAFLRLSARLRKAPLWSTVPDDPDAWARYLNALTRNVFRSAARSERRRRRREAVGGSALACATCQLASPASGPGDPTRAAELREDLAQLERWAKGLGSNGATDRDRQTLVQIQCAYAAGWSSHRELARFIGMSHTEVRRFLARVRHGLRLRSTT